MIDRHALNSAWWGAPVGRVNDPAFFLLPARERNARLADYAWVEFVATDPDAGLRRAAHGAAFAHVDVTVQFRIDLRAHRDAALPCDVAVRAGDDGRGPVIPGAPKPFEHERFTYLRGCDAARLAARYAAWATDLAQSHPATALEVTAGGGVVGWYLARPAAPGLELTLAMAAAGATASGLTLYRAALQAYARLGFRMGFAGYSVHNRAVANVYAALGARLTTTRDVWLWQPEAE